MCKYGRISPENWALRQEGWKNGYQRALLVAERARAKNFRRRRDKRRQKIALLFETQDRCLDCGRKMTLQPGCVNQALLHAVVVGRLICQQCKSRQVVPS